MTMLRIIVMAWMCALGVVGLATPSDLTTAARADAGAVQNAIQGTILLVDENKLTLATGDGLATFTVPGNAQIWLDGVAARLSDLQLGYVATVLAEGSGEDGRMARVIHAYSPM
jgi:hypothetical protein